MSDPLKQYNQVKDGLPSGQAILAACHATLACHLRFEDHPEVQAWLGGAFRKVICRVDEAQFEAAKRYEDHVVMTESALEGVETAIAFRPRAEWPKFFRFLPLYR